MCFVWIWEQTAVISLYSIDWLVFITASECFLRGTSCFCNAVWISISLYGRAVARASCWPFTTETRLRSYVIPCAICGGQCGTGTVFFRVGLLPVSPIITIQSVLRTYFHLCVAVTRTDGRNRGTFPQALLFGSRGALGRKVLSLLNFNAWCNGNTLNL